LLKSHTNWRTCWSWFLLLVLSFLWRKARWEVKKEEASAAEQYEGLAERTLKKLNNEIESNQQLRADVNTLKREVGELKSAGIGI